MRCRIERQSFVLLRRLGWTNPNPVIIKFRLALLRLPFAFPRFSVVANNESLLFAKFFFSFFLSVLQPSDHQFIISHFLSLLPFPPRNLFISYRFLFFLSFFRLLSPSVSSISALFPWEVVPPSFFPFSSFFPPQSSSFSAFPFFSFSLCRLIFPLSPKLSRSSFLFLRRFPFPPGIGGRNFR